MLEFSDPIKKLDVRGERLLVKDAGYDFSKLEPDLLVSGASATGANCDGTIALVNPNNNPNNVELELLVDSVSGTSATSNAGLKAVIDVYTNANVTKPDHGNYDF